jgi:hypothetical protein
MAHKRVSDSQAHYSPTDTFASSTFCGRFSVMCVGTEDRGGIEEDDSENRVNKQAAHIIVAGQ